MHLEEGRVLTLHAPQPVRVVAVEPARLVAPEPVGLGDRSARLVVKGLESVRELVEVVLQRAKRARDLEDVLGKGVGLSPGQAQGAQVSQQRHKPWSPARLEVLGNLCACLGAAGSTSAGVKLMLGDSDEFGRDVEALVTHGSLAGDGVEQVAAVLAEGGEVGDEDVEIIGVKEGALGVG